MILKEVEHVRFHVAETLPAIGDARCRVVGGLYVAQGVVEVYLVVEVVETTYMYIAPVEVYIVYLGNEYYVGVFGLDH